MNKIILLAFVFALTGCVASQWNGHHGEVQLPLYTASHVGSEFEITGNDVKVSNIVDDFNSLRWDAETTIGNYKCIGHSTYEGELKNVVCVKQ